MKTLLHPTYFPNIKSFAVLIQSNVCWEVEDNFQKQTYRNRCYICTDQGKHMLTIPIQHVGGAQGRQKYKEVKLDRTYSWQRQHWRTLETAYRTSPFFEFYEDDIVDLFKDPTDYLLDFNLKSIEILCNCLELSTPQEKTINYTKAVNNDLVDGRFLVNAKKELFHPQEQYTQVFGSKHGFVANTSMLDLLFNEGPNALNYLKNYNLNFLDVTL